VHCVIGNFHHADILISNFFNDLLSVRLCFATGNASGSSRLVSCMIAGSLTGAAGHCLILVFR